MMTIKQAHSRVLNDHTEMLKGIQKDHLKRLKSRTPIDTGEARDSWRIDGSDIINDAPHILHLEYGTKYQPAIGMARLTAIETESIIKKNIQK